MSQKYTGGFITKSPVAPTTTAASGIWTLDQQQQAQKAGTWPSPPIFIEDLFSTFLYTGTGATQTITNGIDLSGQGGLVWIKKRSAAEDHVLTDTVRGAGNTLFSNLTDANEYDISRLSAFTSSGFSVGTSTRVNQSTNTYVSWTFREQPKFFDVVTYTGTGSVQNIPHNLGSVPGCMIVKRLNDVNEWAVYHRSLGATKYMWLNDTTPEDISAGYWNDTTPTSSVFTVGSGGRTNGSGSTYVAYLFAHDAGGFPVSGGGSTNGISCGSWTGTGSTFNVNLGYEPQWLMFKRTDDVGDWVIIDNMRGFTTTGADAYLKPNTSGAESNITGGATLNSTGFSWATGAGTTFIYIAIRRGPMKPPTVGTSVFSPVAYSGTGATRTITAGFPVDLAIPKLRSAATNSAEWYTRLIGPGVAELSAYAFAEQSRPNELTSFASNTGVVLGDSSTSGGTNQSGQTYVDWNFRRAPSFFDEVCYTGTGSDTTQTHNLGVAPELVIIKSRSNAIVWVVGNTAIGFSNYLLLNATDASASGSNVFNNTAPTSTVFSIGAGSGTNQSGATYVAYLFATVAGVSKVGSYTGTGALQTVNCGFTSGARFVLIKRTDSTGNWWVYDSARGITSGNDPYLYLNSTAAEVTGTNYVDTDTTGFQVTAAAPAELNANGGTFIFLAIA